LAKDEAAAEAAAREIVGDALLFVLNYAELGVGMTLIWSGYNARRQRREWLVWYKDRQVHVYECPHDSELRFRANAINTALDLLKAIQSGCHPKTLVTDRRFAVTDVAWHKLAEARSALDIAAAEIEDSISVLPKLQLRLQNNLTIPLKGNEKYVPTTTHVGNSFQENPARSLIGLKVWLNKTDNTWGTIEHAEG
jgi:hypothetical protein